jgi:WD40 repeat protein
MGIKCGNKFHYFSTLSFNYMKRQTLLLLSLIQAAILTAQPTEPMLRIENEMHTAITRRISTDRAGKYILTASEDKTARLWDASNGQLLKIYRIPIAKNNEGKIYSCALYPDGSKAVLGGWTGYEWDEAESIYVIDVQTGEIIKRLKDIPDVINDLEISADGTYIAAGMADGSVYIYNASTLELVKKLTVSDATINNIAFGPDGRLAAVAYDSKIKLYDKNFNLVKEAVSTVSKKVYTVAFNPKGGTLAVGYTDAITIELRDANTLAVIGQPDIKGVEEGDPLNKLCFSADGNYLIAGGLARIDDDANMIYARIYSNGGKGTYSDVPLFSSAVFDIKPLPDGKMAILSGFPALAVMDVKKNVLWTRQASNNKYAAVNKSHFKVSFDAKNIGLTPTGKTAFTFDLENRQVIDEAADYEPPTDKSHGTVVTDWSANYAPKVNGHDVDFLKSNERNLSVDISGSGKEVAYGSDFSINLTDDLGKVIWENEGIPATAWAVNIAANEKVVVAALDDGTIRWYRLNDGKELLAFFIDADKKKWILFTPTGYYDASPGAEDLLGWHINNGPDKVPFFYPLSNFKEKYYRPDVIDEILNVYYEGDAIRLANQKSNKKPPTNVTQDIRQKLPPTVTISSPANGSTVNSNTVTISYSVKTPDDAPVKNVRVLIDGRPVTTVERGVITTAGSDRKVTVTIPAQNCTLTLLAENDNGTSPAANLFLKYESAVASKDEFIYKPKLYVLAIGVSDYTNPDLKLRFAAKDAGDFVASLQKQKGKLYDDVIVRKLVDKDATKDAITDGLDWIQRQTGQKDMAMIFYAGHGVNDNNGIYYMLPVGADMDRIRTTCLNFEELKQTVSSIAGKVVVFIDACHSGNVMGSTTRRGTSDINSLVNELSSTENGAITFTSSTGKEFSLEDVSWGNGAFTKALIEGMSGGAAIAGKEKITIKSLDAFISERVKELTAGRQHPTSVSPPNVPDFPIGVK